MGAKSTPITWEHMKNSHYYKIHQWVSGPTLQSLEGVWKQECVGVGRQQAADTSGQMGMRSHGPQHSCPAHLSRAVSSQGAYLAIYFW